MSEKGVSKLNFENVEQALKTARGYRSRAAQLLNCDRWTLWHFLRQHETWARPILAAIDEEEVDRARALVLSAMPEDWRAAAFVLSTKGGWAQRQEIHGTVTVEHHLSPVERLAGVIGSEAVRRLAAGPVIEAEAVEGEGDDD